MSQVLSYAQTVCGPSGAEHAVSLRFTPSCLSQAHFKVIRNLILAKGSILHVYDVCLIDQPAVNGHVNGSGPSSAPKTKLIHVREHLLHGVVAGLQRIRTTDSERDGLHRLLVSFRDAKMAILEWDAELHDVVPVSLHSYERMPQIAPMLGEGSPGHPLLRAEPSSRCAALLLPASINTRALNVLAILPLFRDQLDNDDLGVDEEADMGDLPYAPSYTIDLAAVIDPKIHRVTDFCFLPGFTEPTLAILHQSAEKETWTGRLENHRDSHGLTILTLASQTPTVILDCPYPLPYNCQRLVACLPQVGGVLVITADACIHLDQSGKFTGCAANGWHKRSSALPLPSGPTPGVGLDGASVAFLSPSVAIVVLKNGDAHSLVLERDGRSLAALRLSRFPLAQTVSPSSLEIVGREFIFVANAVGDSVLLWWTIEGGASPSKKEEEEAGMDIDLLDAALYGEAAEDNRATEVRLDLVDSLPAYGSLRQMVMGPVDINAPPEVVACSGGISTGSLTALYRGIPPCKRRKLNTEPQTEAPLIWTATAAQPVMFVSSAQRTDLYALENNRDGELTPKLDRTEKHATIGVSAFLNRSRICWITQKHVHLLHPDLTVADTPFAVKATPSLKAATFADPYILLQRMDGVISLLQGDETVISKKAIDLGKAPFVGATIFRDVGDTLPVYKPSKASTAKVTPGPVADAMIVDEEDAALYATDSAKSGPSSNNAELQRLVPERDVKFEKCGVFVATMTQAGVFELLSLPSKKSVFSAAGILDLPDAFVNGYQPSKDVHQHQEAIEAVQVEAFWLGLIGETRRSIHLVLLLDNGLLIAWEGVHDFYSGPSSKTAVRQRFVKVLAQQIEPMAEDRPARRLVAIERRGLLGLFVTGDEPLWIFRSDRGPPRAFTSQLKSVSSIASSPSPTGRYLACVAEGVLELELPDLHYDRPVPWKAVTAGRPFSHLAYDGPSQTYVGAGVYQAPFILFDEEGEPLWDPDAPDLLQPMTLRSTLELMIPGTFEVVDGYEFRQHESVLSMTSVSVSTRSTLSGRRQYICCGTAICKGEDITTRGAIYMFEVVPVLDEHGEMDPSAWNRKLRLRFVEDLKSAISNVGSIDGYVYHSMGQKIFCKGWEQDERLLSVAFLDVAFHTTTIVPMKNFLLVGDHVRGLAFVGFQEDPYKLTTLGKETRCGTVVTSDFLVHEGKVVFVVTDLKGVIRIIEYNPAHAEARSGERLLLRTEFQTSSEIASTVVFGRRPEVDAFVQQSGILLAGMDGSLTTVLPVRDPVYRRLALLERQLQRQLPNRPAGLNARAFRTVRNDHVSRALTKGMLDGVLLSRLASLPLSRQEELAGKVNTDLDTIGLNIYRSRGPWG